MALTATTTLEAVNTMLAVIGESPVETVDGALTSDAVMALNVLREVSREVQALGWAFNTETDYPLPLDENGEIPLPLNVLRCDLSGAGGSVDPVIRGQRLYDRAGHSYKFQDAIKAEIVFGLDYEELPETARRYVLIRAARLFQDRVLGSDSLHSYTARDEQAALIALKDAEASDGDYNLLSNQAIARVLNR